MEIQKLPSCDGGVKASKKSKAVGAFRVLLNLLHKPSKKTDTTCADKALTTISCHNHDTATSVRPANNVGARTKERASSCPHTGGRDSDQKEGVSLEMPEVRNIESVIFYHSSGSGVCESVEDKVLDDNNDDDDDDVFLDESYFEDDYIEDFSGGSSECKSDVYRCCDVPEDNFDDAFDDCMDIFGSYNNLNIMETVDKPYNKVIPDFIITTLDESPKLNSKPVPTRQRLYSLPDHLTRTEAPPDACTTRKDFENKHGLKRLYSCVEYSNSKPDVKTTASTREPNLVSVDAGAFQDSATQNRSSKTESQCQIPFMNDLSDMPVSNPSDNHKVDPAMIVGMEKVAITNQNEQMTLSWKSISELKSLSKYSDMKSGVFDKSGGLSDIRPDAMLQEISAKPDQVLLEDGDEDINVSSRRSSIESGYVTSVRASSSGPVSPPKRKDRSRSLNRDLMTTMPSPFTIGQFDERAFCESASPTFIKPPTPLYQLHFGTPLSPNSRDTIDGIADTNKPRPHPRKTLKPKFIFPSPNTNTASTASPASNLKPVAELGESSSGNFDESIEYQHKDNRLTGKTNIFSEQETVGRTEAPSPSIHIGVNIGNTPTHERTVSNPSDFNLNVSVSIVDMKKVTRVEQEISERQPGAMSCFPPSPPDVKATTLGTPIITPILESNTPTRRTTTLTDYLNDIVFTSPFGKALRPICTSSPLPNKFAPHTRKMANSATETRTVAVESSPIIPLEIDYKRSAHEPDGKSKKRDHAQRSNSDRRKRLVKRKSARARLDFDSQENMNDSDLKYDAGTSVPGFGQPMSGDYVLLKRIAEQIVLQCPYREFIFSWVDVPALMENVKAEYDKIMKSDYFKSKQIHRVSRLKGSVNNSRHMLSNVTLDNCLDILFMSLLVQDKQRTSRSLDFVFENLPRVIHKHGNLSHLAPEVVMLLLCNQRCVVKNNHGFSLSYSQSEKEVFKAGVKYVDAVQKRNRAKHSFITRVKNLLSIIADPRVLTNGNMSSADKRLLKESRPLQPICQPQSGYVSSTEPISKKPPPPRPYHEMKFTKSSHPSDNRDREYFFQPFLSSFIHSLDEILHKGTENATPITMAAISDENFILRKLYFSYRRCNISCVPYISKIGMQYSHKTNKKTVFVAPSRLVAKTVNPVSGSRSDNREGEIKLLDSTSLSKTGTEVNNGAARAAVEGTTHHFRQDSTTKKAAIVLRAGEHVTGIYVLGQRALHNIEVVTNTGRRIRAHSLQDVPSDAKWVALAMPSGSAPVCLHALYGDLHTSSSGRSHIRDVGALWISPAPSEMDLR